MPTPNQTDLMIARIEEANARAYERFARADERALKPPQDPTPLSSSQPIAHPDPMRRPSRAARLFVVAFIGLLLLVATFVTAFVWKPSYGDAAKLIVARSANAWISQTVSQSQTKSRTDDPAARLTYSEITQRLQKLSDDFANLKQQIEQFKASQEKLVRDNASVVEQVNTALAQMTRQGTEVAKELKASQEQLAEMASANAARRRRR
jgi:capsular polysaccharide biosynthesis protein